MKFFLNIILSCCTLALAGCMVRYPSSPAPADTFKNKYADKLEPGATLVDWGYIYTFESTADGQYIYKEFYPETRQLVLFQAYADRTRTIAEGPYKSWWDDGSPAYEGNYKNGKREGQWIQWSSKSKSIGDYKNGLQEGIWVGYDSTGNKRSELTLLGSKQNGPYKYWNEAGQLTREGSYANDKIVSETVHIKQGDTAEKELVTAELPPHFPGCNTGTEEERIKCSESLFLKFIHTNIKYPPFARENGIQGSAYVEFVVEKDGSITNIKTLKGVSPDIKEECERVIRKMPKWDPGQQNGKPVRVEFVMPIKFKLQ